MKLTALALTAVLAAACCTNKNTSQLDHAIDVAAPVAKGYLCSQPVPPTWLPHETWVGELWAAARAMICTPPAPAVDAGAEVAPVPVPTIDAAGPDAEPQG